MFCWFFVYAQNKAFGLDAYGYFITATLISTLVIFLYGIPISSTVDTLTQKFRYPELGSFFLHILAGLPTFVFPPMSYLGSFFSTVFWLIDRGVEKVFNKSKKGLK